MQPTMFLLYGFPGVGKLTVAEALAARLEAAGSSVRVVDNHWIANPVFGLIEQDGVTPLPGAVWERVGEVADAVLGTIEELTPRSWQLIFTAVLDGVTDAGYDERLRNLASTRGAVFVPVRLTCEPEENARRIVSPERRVRMKSADAGEPFRLAAAGRMEVVDHPNALTLDITAVTPAEAAAAILEQRGSHGMRRASRQPA